MEICTCHYKEDLTWLLDGSPWPVTIVHKEGGDPVQSTWTIPNVGTEPPAYLWYIIQRYDTLPDHVAFIHGHEHSPHQQGDRPLLEMIRDAQVQKYGYVPLNNFWHCPQLDGLHGYLEPIVRKWSHEAPNRFITCSGAQFIVSRERIRARSKSFYADILKNTTTRDDGIGLEMTWHVIFGEPWTIIPRDYFEPPVRNVRYSLSINLPMKTSDLNFVYVGKKMPGQYVASTGQTCIIFAGDEFAFDMSQQEVVVCEPIDLVYIFNIFHKVCREYEKLYLEALASC
jgi:hypothetical protein